MSTTRIVLLTITVSLAAACRSSTAPSANVTRDAVVLSVVPTGGTTGVNPAAPITVVFGQSMMSGMEALVVLHEGGITGPQVSGLATWSGDRSKLTFTPTAPLKPRTTYALHFSPNLKDENGNAMNWAGCASALNGQGVPSGTFGSGMMGGGMGPGMMGPGWQGGSGPWGYGMYLTFMTT